jgi:hypothetical protein
LLGVEKEKCHRSTRNTGDDRLLVMICAQVAFWRFVGDAVAA